MPIFIASAVCVFIKRERAKILNSFPTHPTSDHITTKERNFKSRGGCSSFFGYTNSAKHGYRKDHSKSSGTGIEIFIPFTTEAEWHMAT